MPLAAGDNRTVIDPLARWRQYGEKPDYAGLLTYGGAPYTQDPAELAGFDVAIVGAPTDDLVSDRPGARFGPRAIRAASCPPGPHLESKVDAFEELKIVDFGDAAVLPADAVRSHAAIEQLVGQVCDAGLLPIVLGGDHSIAACERSGSAGTTPASPKSSTRSSAKASTLTSRCGPGGQPAARIARGASRAPGRSETRSSIGAPTMATSKPSSSAGSWVKGTPANVSRPA